MKAIVYETYGTPNVLKCEEVKRPSPAAGQVLLRIRAAGVNPLDAGELKGIPPIFRVVFGLRKPEAAHPGRPGVDVAGTVEGVGAGVTQFRLGDEVFGVCVNNPDSGLKVWVHDEGTFAEYACVPARALAMKPKNIGFEQAASVPVAALTALQGLRDKGHIEAGRKALIHGAGGGVGTFAVQIAKAFGAEVTAVTSTANLGLVRALGADHTIDYTQTDFTAGRERYDLVLDCHGNHSLSACRRVLNPRGVYVVAGGSGETGAFRLLLLLLQMLVFAKFTARKTVTLLARPVQKDLATLSEYIAAGKIVPVVDRCFALNEVPDAMRYLSEGRARGKVVISVQ